MRKKKNTHRVKILELEKSLIEMKIEMHILKILNELYVAQLELLNQSENKKKTIKLPKSYVSI